VPLPQAPSERRIAWAADLIACLYFAWLYVVLVRHTSALAEVFKGLGAEVPGSTALLLQHYQWFYPTLLGGAGLFVVAKEWWVQDKRVSTALTFALALLVQALADHCRQALFYPLIDMMRKLS
jgi:hypothetical protein